VKFSFVGSDLLLQAASTTTSVGTAQARDIFDDRYIELASTLRLVVTVDAIGFGQCAPQIFRRLKKSVGAREHLR
jgi:hypothetical protein